MPSDLEVGRALQAIVEVPREAVSRHDIEPGAGEQAHSGLLGLPVALGERLEHRELARDVEVVGAEKAGVCLLPGAGFDVVPTDCTAGHLHDRLQSATHLRLGFEAPTSVSGGTVASAIEHASAGGKVRRDGVIEEVPLGGESRSEERRVGKECRL